MITFKVNVGGGWSSTLYWPWLAKFDGALSGFEHFSVSPLIKLNLML